ncbi:glycoside hydrolase family 127 protein [Parabacteroides sp. FAFU027]|uniref:glycoside hydrolase family 127 protein n=1 Tax=Parabacteroides sp. FAFU027 TaxID=2922715 RepID=UPI001FAFA536|nr:glycoside hydrolase family 127 protein [Parabacteroides sp. FAFU027]
MRTLHKCILFLFLIISANVKAANIQEFKLSDVKILDGPFLNAQQVDLKYILALDPDRLLAPFLKDTGIKPLKENYGNWESSGLDGHIGGHYLSALSMMYATTGNQELLRRVNYMVDWLDKCQQKNGNGYVAGIPNGHSMWTEIAAGNTAAVKSRWVPLYNIHKLYAGLLDAYQYTNNKKALDIVIKLSDWFYDLSKNLTDEQIQEILKAEHGGLNESFAQVATITGNKKYLDLAIRVSHRALLDPLIQQKVKLAGLHANTQIPKVIGFKCIADATSNMAWDSAAVFFWNTVVNKWSVSIGGNSVREHFHPANDFSSMIETNQGPETCNTYNMLKLTELLYRTNPDTRYMDYYERALFNHILSSEHPTKGGFVYFTQMRPRHYRVYSQPQESFWCCVGTGMENHAKYGEMIYAHEGNNLYVNLFIASELKWKEKGIKLTQNTRFPYKDFSTFKLQMAKPGQLALKIRKPAWANEKEIKIGVNGKSLEFKIESNYIVLSRTWNNGDEIKIEMPMHIGVENLPDGSPWASVKYGPIVLAAISDSTHLDGLFADDSRWGHVASGPYYAINEAPMIISEEKDFSSKIKPVVLEHLTFEMPDLIYPQQNKNMILRPFFEIHEARYVIYWPVSTMKDFEAKKQAMAEKEKAKLVLEKRTIDQIAPGEQQPETDHNFKGEETNTGINNSVHWRDASAWFGYDLFDKQKEATVLQVTYFGLDRKRTFDIFLNDTKLETVTLNGDKGDAFFTVDYVIPEEIKKANNGVLKLKFVAAPKSKAGGVYYIRLMK